MSNIVGTYLMFKANNVCEYINILAGDMRKVSKIPKQLNKLIYKYYDLFVLSNKEIDEEMLRKKTGIDEFGEKVLLFYLLIEFDFASKTEFRDNELFQFYDFLVNSIIIFVELENSKVIKRQREYDDVMPKIMKRHLDKLREEDILLYDKMNVLLGKQYVSSLKKEIKFDEMYKSNTYSVHYTKIKKSNEFYLERLRYKNEKLLTESKKDIILIDDEFKAELDFINIELLSMRILRDVLGGLERKIFVQVADEIISKKSKMEDFIDMIKLRFLKERIVFIINTSLLDKYEDRINYLILEGFNISYMKNDKLTPYDIYKNGGYLIVDYDELEEGISFNKEYHLEIIANKVNKKNIDKLRNIKYYITL